VPNYKLADVRNFLDGFFRVDKNLSGLLDVDEWVEFFLTMNKSMTAQAARQLFSHVDTNRDGVLSLHELVPVIFSEATSSQVSLILKYIDEEVTRNMKTYRKDEIYKEDMAILFETYDADNIGYIKVQLVRDKLAQFRLPVAAQLAFTQKLKDMEDGDMVNLPEFTRMFISYMSYRNEENDDDD
jgi:Ca2+-binding EF-hand superfamily protein